VTAQNKQLLRPEALQKRMLLLGASWRRYLIGRATFIMSPSTPRILKRQLRGSRSGCMCSLVVQTTRRLKKSSATL
jgi:hypothetical protein